MDNASNFLSQVQDTLLSKRKSSAVQSLQLLGRLVSYIMYYCMYYYVIGHLSQNACKEVKSSEVTLELAMLCFPFWLVLL